MSRSPIDFRTAGRKAYLDFKKKHPSSTLTSKEWKEILYSFNLEFRNYILETGEKIKMPFGFGEFSIVKRKRKKLVVTNGIERINLPVDWKKSKEKGKKIYNFNHHTEGYFFGWKWFRYKAMFKFSDLWLFQPTRTTKRELAKYLKSDEKYQHIYSTWNIKE